MFCDHCRVKVKFQSDNEVMLCPVMSGMISSLAGYKIYNIKLNTTFVGNNFF